MSRVVISSSTTQTWPHCFGLAVYLSVFIKQQLTSGSPTSMIRTQLVPPVLYGNGSHLRSKQRSVDARDALPSNGSHVARRITSPAASHTGARPLPSQILPSFWLACVLAPSLPPPCRQTHPTKATRKLLHTRALRTRGTASTPAASTAGVCGSLSGAG